MWAASRRWRAMRPPKDRKGRLRDRSHARSTARRRGRPVVPSGTTGRRREACSAAQAGSVATPGGANRRPVARSETPVRSRYGVIPPSQNGQPAPVIIAEVDVGGIGDDALVQDQPGLLGHGASPPGRSTCSAVRRLVALHQQRGDLRIEDLPTLRRPRPAGSGGRRRRSGAGSPRPGTGHRTRRAASPARAGRPPARTSCISIERAHRQPERVPARRPRRRRRCPRRSPRTPRPCTAATAG